MIVYDDIFLEKNRFTQLVRDEKLKKELSERGVSIQIRKVQEDDAYDTLHISTFHPEGTGKEDLKPLIHKVSDEIADRYGFFILRTTYQNTFEKEPTQ